MRKYVSVLILLVVLSVVLSSCGPFRSKPNPTATPAPPVPTQTAVPATDTPVPAPTDRPAATEEPSEGPSADGDEEAVDGLANFQTYTSRSIFRVDGVQNGQVVTSTLETVVKADNEIDARSIVVTFGSSEPIDEDDDGFGSDGINSYEIIRIGDTSWMSYEGSWIQSSGEAVADTGTPDFSADDFASEIEVAELISSAETVSGIVVNHYRFGKVAMSEEKLADMGNVDSLQVDVWIAKEGGFLVKMDFVAEGKELDVGEGAMDGKVEITYEIVETNQPVTIEPPETAGAADMPGFEEDTFPMLEDAEVQMLGMGVLIYLTDTSVDDAVKFYQEELAALGWELEDEPMSYGGLTFLDATRGGFSLAVQISADEDLGRTAVNAYAGEAE